MITLSFIVPMYKVERFVRECLESILAIAMPASDYEIIAVDDGSPDQSAHIVQSLMTNHPQIRLLQQPNQGLSVARNNGLKVAQGEYVWFVDSDDRIVPDWVLEMVQTLLHIQPNMMRIGATFEDQPQRGKVFTREWMSSATTILEPTREVCVPFYIYKRTFLTDNRLTFKPGIYHEDNEFQPRAIFLARQVYGFVGEPVYWVRSNSNSITHNYSFKRIRDIFHTSIQELYHLTLGDWSQADWLWKKAILKNIRWNTHSMIRYFFKR